jgi:hypothetical protein
MGRALEHDQDGYYIVMTSVDPPPPISPTFKTTAELVDWLVGRGYSRKAAEKFIKEGYACIFVNTRRGLVTNINQFDPENSRGDC